MNKKKLLQKIVGKFEQDLEMYYNVARSSHQEATDPQNKAENKYDTRGLEASYLAGGQARQAATTEAVLIVLRQFVPRDFEADEAINLGALVGVEVGSEQTHFFMAPRGGGLEVKLGALEVFVLTPQSSLGQLLMGRKVGDKFKLEQGNRAQQQRIVSVQ